MLFSDSLFLTHSERLIVANVFDPFLLKIFIEKLLHRWSVIGSVLLKLRIDGYHVT